MQITYSLLGGIIIGLATSLFLVMNGRLVGISGIIGSMLTSSWSECYWRILFILGLILGGFVMLKLFPQFSYEEIPGSSFTLFFGALLIGFGTRLGSGCTSGHGVCGISRGSVRSIAATIIFIFSAMVTVFIVKRIML